MPGDDCQGVADGGFEMADVVRAHYYITDPAFVDVVFPILGETFGEIRPAATMIVCQPQQAGNEDRDRSHGAAADGMSS